MNGQRHYQPGLIELWFCSFLFILGANPAWLTDWVCFVGPPQKCLLSPADQWFVPISRILFLPLSQHLPYALFAAIGGFFIAAACRPTFATDSGPFPCFGLVGLSLLVTPALLTFAAPLLMAVSIARSRRLRATPLLRDLLWGLSGIVAVMCSLEFGLILACSVLIRTASADEPHDSRTWIVVSTVCILLLWLSIFALNKNLLSTAIRPVSWIWLSEFRDLLPNTATILQHREHLLIAGFLGLCLARLFWLELQQPVLYGVRIIRLVALLGLGLGCFHYLWPASFAAISITGGRGDHHQNSKTQVMVRRVVLGVAFCLVLFNARVTVNELMGASVVPTSLDPTKWNADGNVALMNLNRASDWEGRTGADQFQLILNDRWDVFADQYDQYEAFRNDVESARMMRYLRDDGSWGGANEWVSRWSPGLIVIDSDNLEAIRNLSTSPDWNLMGIDSRETILGHVKEPRTVPQQRRALETLMSLEWPPASQRLSMENTVVVKDERSRLAVANVLCAARFPYAGLRFVGQLDDAPHQKARMWCFLALASRVHRHSGVASLLDQGRATRLIRQLFARGHLSDDERSRIARSVAEFELFDLAAAVFPEGDFTAAEQQYSDSLQHTQLRKLSATGSASYSPEESSLRQAIASGDGTRTRVLLAGFSGGSLDYYQLLEDAKNQSNSHLTKKLNILIQNGRISPQMKAEALFYLGCISIEDGQTGVAIKSFNESRLAAPNSPFSAIRELYLSQLDR